MDSWSGAQRQNLSVVIYHTLFSYNEEQFYQTGFKMERLKRELELENTHTQLSDKENEEIEQEV